MKNILSILFFILLLQVACKKENNDFVDSFTPTLTDPVKTTYPGDYFPFQLYNFWEWSGYEYDNGSVSYSSPEGNASESIDSSKADSGYMAVKYLTSITLSTGTYNVLETKETGNINRFFQSTDTALIIRAIRLSDSGGLIEVKNPVFLRKPLVVGDKWQSQPYVDYNQLVQDMGGEITTSNINTKCLMFVIGKDNVNRKDTSRDTVVVEERAEITGFMNTDEEGMTGKINLNFTVDAMYYLLKNFGIVDQTMILQGTVNGTFSSSEGSESININITSNQTLALDSCYLNETPLIKKVPNLKPCKINPQTGNKLADKSLKKALTLVGRIKKMLL
jgi:hypothetical protein